MHYKVEVFIPVEAEEKLIEALHAQGLLAGGSYDYAYTSMEVIGHWRPLEGARPYEGTLGKCSQVRELQLEFRILDHQKEVCESIIRRNHPYETPVINFIPLI